MKQLKQAIAFVTLLAGFAHAGTITGTVTNSASGPVANGTFTLTLTQPAVLTGTATITAQSASCYTDANGNVVGEPNPPAGPVVTSNLASGTLAAGIYFVRLTYQDATGETIASPETAFTMTGPGTLIVNAPIVQPAGATAFRVYLSTSSGNETLQGSVSGTPGAWGNYSQAAPLTAGSALPASNSTACKIAFNDQLQPSFTGYNVTLTSQSGITVPGYPQLWYLFGGSNGTVNLSNGTPLYSGVITVQYPQAIVSIPALGGSQNVNGPLSANPLCGNINGDLWVGNTTCPNNFSSMSACYAALVPGQGCHVVPNWAETWTSNLVMNKSHTGFIFHGSAIITMGSNSLKIPDLDAGGVKMIGVYLKGLGGTPYDPVVSGVSFQYGGNGKAFQIGDGTGSGGSGNHSLENIGVDLITAGSSAIAVYQQDPADGYYTNLSIHTNTLSGATSQKGFVCDASTFGCAGNTFYGPLFAANIPLTFLSGSQQNHVYGGMLQAVGNSNIALDMAGNSNEIRTGVQSSNIAVQIENSSAAQGNEITIANNNNTTDYVEASGSASVSHDNTVKFLNASTAQSSNLLNTVTIPGRKTGASTLLNQQPPAGTLTGNSADQTIFTYTLPANTLAQGKGLRITLTFLHSSGSASTVYKLFFGATVAATITYAPNGNTFYDRYVFEIYNDANSQSSQSHFQKTTWPNLTGFASPGAAYSTNPLSNPSVNFANSQAIKFTFNVANTDQITPGDFQVEFIQ